MDHSQARHIAESVVFKLKPFVERILIAGSIRRQKKQCSDIDIVVIPSLTSVAVPNLFGSSLQQMRHPGFIEVIDGMEKLKGDPRGKYCQRMFQGMKVEISIATKQNFGCIAMIRTGDADFSHLMMKRVRKCGLEQRDGFLWNYENKIVPVYEEEDYFKILGLPYVKPEARNADAFKRAMPA